MDTEYKKGLEGVIAVESAISYIDGQKGILTYRGYNIEELALNYSFEEVSFLLLKGYLPNETELHDFEKLMSQNRKLPKYIKEILEKLPKTMSYMGVLRTAISALQENEDDYLPSIKTAIKIISITPTIISYWCSLKEKTNALEPDLNMKHVENYLYMLKGIKPHKDQVKALETYLILTMEHGLNASTFTARVIISSESDFCSAISGAIGTMKGPLHGGAPSEVILMLNEIETKENIDKYVEEKLENKEKLMGFGHRVYKTIDPRAQALKKVVANSNEDEDKWLDLALTLEKRAIELLEEYKPGRGLYTNVEFYAAAVLKSLNIPVETFTPTFTMSRVVGWSANVIEQYENNRIFRPSSKYIGN